MVPNYRQPLLHRHCYTNINVSNNNHPADVTVQSSMNNCLGTLQFSDDASNVHPNCMHNVGE